MDALAFLRTQAATANDFLTLVVGNLTSEQAAWHAPGTTANPIAPTFLHVCLSEDRPVQRIQGRPPFLEQRGWRARLGDEPDAPWSPLASAGWTR